MKRLEDYENAYRKLWFDAAVEVDGSLWFSANNLNGIFRSDKKNGESHFIIKFPQYPNDAVRLFTACTIVKRKIIFAPCNAKEIAVYDIDREELNMLPLENRIIKHCKSALFYAAFDYEGFAYLVGMSYPVIVRIDVMTYELYVIKEPFERYCCKGKYDYKAHFRHSFVMRDNILYLPAICENGLVCMDMKTYKCEFLEILPKGSKAWEVCCINNHVLTWGTDFKLSNYNLETNKIKVIDVEHDGKFTEGGAYLVPNGTKLWIFRLDSKDVINYDIESGEIIGEIKNINSFSAGMNQSYSRLVTDVIILSKGYWDHSFWVFNSIINEFVRVDDSGKAERKCFRADDKWNIIDYIWSGRQQKDRLTTESANMDLLEFMALIKNEEKDKGDKDERIYGGVIYRKISSLFQEV